MGHMCEIGISAAQWGSETKHKKRHAAQKRITPA